MANEVVRLLDVAMDSRVLTDAEFWLRCQLKKKVLGLASLQRTIAHQKSRILWLKEGEANTQYFQAFASARRRRNHIFRLRTGEVEASTPADMDSVGVEHFVSPLGMPMGRDMCLQLDALDLPCVDTSSLESCFSE